MATKPKRPLPKNRAEWTFGELLAWHFRRGTRSKGTPNEPGTQWNPQTFAEKLGGTDRAIRNWLNDANSPSNEQFGAIEIALFGDNASEQFAEWKQELRDKRAQKASETSAADTVAGSSTASPEKPLRCYGRDDDLKLVATVLASGQSPTAILILGGPGMGKTTLTRQAANDPAVVDRFQARRWFVELETSKDLESFEVEIVRTIGLDPKSAKFDSALEFLGRAVGLLILDNLETPWEANSAGIEQRLAQLAAIPGLALLASIRGNDPPGGLRWDCQRTMHPLGSPYDGDLFRDIAKDIAADDPHLKPLLTELSGVPLAVELLAYQAAPHNTLAAVYREWLRAGSALARRRGVEPSRLTALDRSLELSFGSRRLGNAGRRLFSLLGQLPAGIASDDLDTMLNSNAFEAQQGLLSCGLGIEHDGRVDLLPPVRDHAKRNHGPSDSDASMWISHYLSLASKDGERAVKGTAALKRIARDVPNINAAIYEAIKRTNLKMAVESIYGVAVVMRFTGWESTKAIGALAEACRAEGDKFGEAQCLSALADLAHYRGHLDEARQSYEAALMLCRQVKSIRGEANCTARLGEIATRQNRAEAGKNLLDGALPLFRKIKDAVGEANCLARLADIALMQKDFGLAQDLCDRALPLFKSQNQILGQANCIARLGDIASARSDLDRARAAYLDALAFYKRIPEPFNMGLAHYNLARLSVGKDMTHHLAEAKAAWESVNRYDLVEKYHLREKMERGE